MTRVAVLAGFGILYGGTALSAMPENRRRQDLHRLRSFSRELKEMESEMEQLRDSIQVVRRGHFTADEHSAVEGLFFRYLVCRDALWELVDAYRRVDASSPRTRAGAQGFVLGFNAALKLAYYSSRLVVTFMDDSRVVAKLNQPLHPYDIPAKAYDRIFASITSIENIRALRGAWQLFLDEAADPDSLLHALSREDQDYRELVRENSVFFRGADEQIQTILTESSLLLPDVRNRLRHSAINALVRRAKERFEGNLYAARGLLFTNLSRIRDPFSGHVRLDSKQMRRVGGLLRPGDILLTYSSGYMSNVFLPGRFKHGIVYVGSPQQRREAGLGLAGFADTPVSKRTRLAEALTLERLEDGHPADCVEAVAEGVVFNSIERLLSGKVYRVVVLRPRFTAEQRLEGLKRVFLLLGVEYDFKFDFDDATYLCCTEVIYRAYHRQGPVDFRLVTRMGVPTLSADDIIDCHLSTSPKAFDFVLLTVPVEDGSGRCRLLTGRRGRRALRQLME